MSVQGGDDRDLDVEQVPDELLGVAAEGLQAPGLLQGREPREVAAGREGAPPSGEQHGARLGLALQARAERGQVVVQALVDRVERARRVVDGDAQHVPDPRELEGREVLARHSIAVSASRPSRMRPASSSVAGATIMCWVATWMSRKQRWSGLAA